MFSAQIRFRRDGWTLKNIRITRSFRQCSMLEGGSRRSRSALDILRGGGGPGRASCLGGATLKIIITPLLRIG
ncbi:hypothetical protein PUN28_004486 [Cardiocondyla obscurior]|uniref:Uncharacterized protein n=1 Tax=Cardiocondyla obscurior TaxID=286306 RepID=A0AAW2GCP9_9HYME